MNSIPWVIRLTHREYWPMWLYYLPVGIQHIWLSIKTGSAFFFLRTNPGIDGFILSDSKFKTMQLVPKKYLPKTLKVNPQDTFQEIEIQIRNMGLSWPLIVKPDVGFRGIQVRKIDSVDALETFLKDLKTEYLIQEFVPGNFEVGIFYYRFPDQYSGTVTSITIKEFLSVTGNGKDPLKTLIKSNPRAILQEKQLAGQFCSNWKEIIPANKILQLGHIGSHNLGTKFRNGIQLNDQELLEVMNKICLKMEGFYYGRFDIKADSIEDLRAGRLKILEVNGVGGEPTHIYDPAVSFSRALTDLCRIWRIAARVAQKNMKGGYSKPSFNEAFHKWRQYRHHKTYLRN